MASCAGTQKMTERVEKCHKCQKVTDKDYGVQCEICEEWFHLKCVNMKEEAYKYLSIENLHWFCDSCTGGVGKILSNMVRLQLRQDEMEKVVAELETKFKEDIAKVENEMSKMRKELITLNQKTSGINTKDSKECVQEVKSEIGKRAVEEG